MKKPRNIGIFFDETEEECYNSVITGYEDTIHLYQKKINMLTEEVFRLHQVIEKFDTDHPESISQVYLAISPSQSPAAGQKADGNDGQMKSVVPTSSTKEITSPRQPAKKAVVVFQEFNLPENLSGELKSRFTTLTGKENQIYDLISKSENIAALSKCEKFLAVYVKATKAKMKDECPKISQKDKEGKEGKNAKSVKDKAATKIKKNCLLEIKEAHENRVQLLQHVDDPKLIQRILALITILDDILFVLTN